MNQQVVVNRLVQEEGIGPERAMLMSSNAGYQSQERLESKYLKLDDESMELDFNDDRRI